MHSGRIAATVALLAVLVTFLIVTTPAAGAREGVQPGPARTAAGRPAAKELSIVGLGDSVVAGTACDCETFVQRYAQIVAVRTGAQVRWQNDGAGGLTSSGLLADLRSGSIADDVRTADVVLITIGANDLNPAIQAWQDGGCDTACETTDLPAMSANITQILARVRQLQGSAPSLVAVTDYWNVFEDGAVADQDYGPGFADWSDTITRLANTAICSAAHSATACVDLYGPFNKGGEDNLTGLLADDGDHPDAAGHEVIAQALAAAVMPRVCAHGCVHDALSAG